MYKFPFYHRYAALLPPLSPPPYNNTIIWWRYTLLWTLVQLKDASTNLHPNILLSTLLSNTPNPSYRARDQVSHPHDTRKITKDSSLLGLHAVTHIHNNTLTDQYTGFVTLKDFELPDNGFE